METPPINTASADTVRTSLDRRLRVVQLLLAAGAAMFGYYFTIGAFEHKCDAGIRAVETASPFVVAVLCGSAFLVFRRRPIALIAAVAVLSSVPFVSTRYKTWVHDSFTLTLGRTAGTVEYVDPQGQILFTFDSSKKQGEVLELASVPPQNPGSVRYGLAFLRTKKFLKSRGYEVEELMEHRPKKPKASPGTSP